MKLPVEATGFLSLFFLVVLYMDIRWRKIPNWLTVPAALLGISYHIAAGGLPGGFFSLTGLLVGLAVLLMPFLLGGTGGGDLKLLGATGCWLGAWGVFNLFLYGALTGGLISLVLIAKKGTVIDLKNIYYDIISFIYKTENRTESVKSNYFPYSIPLAVGWVIYLVLGPVAETFG